MKRAWSSLPSWTAAAVVGCALALAGPADAYPGGIFFGGGSTPTSFSTPVTFNDDVNMATGTTLSWPTCTSFSDSAASMTCGNVNIGGASSTVTIGQPGALVIIDAWDVSHDGEVRITGRGVNIDDGGAAFASLTCTGPGSFAVEDAATTSAVTALTVSATSSGTPGTGFGPKLSFTSEPTTGGSAVEHGAITTATDTGASTSSTLNFWARIAGTLTNIMTVSGLNGGRINMNYETRFGLSPVVLGNGGGVYWQPTSGTSASVRGVVLANSYSSDTKANLVIGVPETKRALWITDIGNASDDYGLADQSNPTVCVPSAATTTSQFWCAAHNGTNPAFTSYAGGFVFRNNVSSTALQSDTDQDILAGGGGRFCARSTATCVRESNGLYLQSTTSLGTYVQGRFQTSKGSDVVAANDLTLGSGGNYFIVTGNTTINAVTTSNWQGSVEVYLEFTGTPTVKHNTAGGAGTAKIMFSSGADFSATADDVVKLVYNGTVWKAFPTTF